MLYRTYNIEPEFKLSFLHFIKPEVLARQPYRNNIPHFPSEISWQPTIIDWLYLQIIFQWSIMKINLFCNTIFYSSSYYLPSSPPLLQHSRTFGTVCTTFSSCPPQNALALPCDFCTVLALHGAARYNSQILLFRTACTCKLEYLTISNAHKSSTRIQYDKPICDPKFPSTRTDIFALVKN